MFSLLRIAVETENNNKKIHYLIIALIVCCQYRMSEMCVSVTQDLAIGATHLEQEDNIKDDF